MANGQEEDQGLPSRSDWSASDTDLPDQEGDLPGREEWGGLGTDEQPEEQTPDTPPEGAPMPERVGRFKETAGELIDSLSRMLGSREEGPGWHPPMSLPEGRELTEDDLSEMEGVDRPPLTERERSRGPAPAEPSEPSQRRTAPESAPASPFVSGRDPAAGRPQPQQPVEREQPSEDAYAGPGAWSSEEVMSRTPEERTAIRESLSAMGPQDTTIAEAEPRDTIASKELRASGEQSARPSPEEREGEQGVLTERERRGLYRGPSEQEEPEYKYNMLQDLGFEWGQVSGALVQGIGGTIESLPGLAEMVRRSPYQAAPAARETLTLLGLVGEALEPVAEPITDLGADALERYEGHEAKEAKFTEDPLKWAAQNAAAPMQVGLQLLLATWSGGSSALPSFLAWAGPIGLMETGGKYEQSKRRMEEKADQLERMNAPNTADVIRGEADERAAANAWATGLGVTAFEFVPWRYITGPASRVPGAKEVLRQSIGRTTAVKGVAGGLSEAAEEGFLQEPWSALMDFLIEKDTDAFKNMWSRMKEAAGLGLYGGGTVGAASTYTRQRNRHEAARQIVEGAREMRRRVAVVHREGKRRLALSIDPSIREEVEEYEQAATTDWLTGLQNRTGEEQATEQREVPDNAERVVFTGDIDNFKAINDAMGFKEGDKALQVAAEALQEETRDDDAVVAVARPGGDEFRITMDIRPDSDMAAIRERLEERVNEALAEEGYAEADGTEVGISVGIGEDYRARKEERGVSEGREEVEPEAEQDEGLPEEGEPPTEEEVAEQPTPDRPDLGQIQWEEVSTGELRQRFEPEELRELLAEADHESYPTAYNRLARALGPENIPANRGEDLLMEYGMTYGLARTMAEDAAERSEDRLLDDIHYELEQIDELNGQALIKIHEASQRGLDVAGAIREADAEGDHSFENELQRRYPDLYADAFGDQARGPEETPPEAEPDAAEAADPDGSPSPLQTVRVKVPLADLAIDELQRIRENIETRAQDADDTAPFEADLEVVNQEIQRRRVSTDGLTATQKQYSNTMLSALGESPSPEQDAALISEYHSLLQELITEGDFETPATEATTDERIERLGEVVEQMSEPVRNTARHLRNLVDSGQLNEVRRLAILSDVRSQLAERGLLEAAEQAVAPSGYVEMGPQPYAAADQGRTTQIKAPNGLKLRGRYVVMEAEDLIGSHNPFNFNPNPAYPEGVQDRRYESDQQAQQRVHDIEAHFDPDEYLDPTIQAAAGPSIVLPDGKILSGFNRYAAAIRVYRNRPELAEQLRNAQVERAQTFAVNPERVREKDQPIIVRTLTPASLREQGYDAVNREDLAALSSAFNDPIAKARDTTGDAVVRAKRLADTPGALSDFLQGIGTDQTLRSYLATARGRDFVKTLVATGIITENEAGQFFDEAGELTETAKLFVERMMYATVVQDADLISRAPDQTLRYIEKSIPAIVQASQTVGYDIRTEVQHALDILARVQQNDDIETLEEFLRQGSLLEEDQDPLAVEMAKFLENRAGGTYYIFDGLYRTEEEARELIQNDERWEGTAEDIDEILETLPTETFTAPQEMRRAFTLFAMDAAKVQEAIDARESAGDLFGDPPPLPPADEKFRRRFIERDYSEPQVDIPGLEGGAAELGYQRDVFESPAEGVLESRELTRDQLEDMSYKRLARMYYGMTEQLDQHNSEFPLEPDPFASEAEADAVRHDIQVLNPWLFRKEVEHKIAAGADPQNFRNRWDALWPDTPMPGEAEAMESVERQQAAEPEEPPGEPEAPLGQGDLFGTAAPAEGGEQFKLFGDPNVVQKEGLSEAEEEASRRLRELAPKMADGTATDEQATAYREAIKLLRRSEKFTADEVRQMIRAGKWKGFSERQPQAEDQEEMFSRVSHPEHTQNPDFAVEKFIDSLAELGMGGAEYAEAGPFEQAPDERLEDFPAGFESKNLPPRSEIVGDLMEALRIPIRTGRYAFRGAGHLGVYKVIPEAIRTQWANDIETTFHEVGHHMHKLLFGEEGLTPGGFLSKKVLKPWEDELLPLAEGISDESIVEGEAEFIRLFGTNPEAAREQAPEFYEFVVDTLEQTEPAILEALEAAREKYRRFRAGSSEGRIFSKLVNIGDERTINMQPSVLLNEGYRQAIDQFFPAVEFRQEMGGQDAADIDIDQWLDGLLRLTRASAAMAEQWLYKGQIRLPEGPTSEDVQEVGPALSEILAPVEEDLELFTVWTIAARSLERKQRGFKETGIRDEDAEEVFHKYKDRQDFRTAFQGIQNFRENQLQFLVDHGVMTQETMDRIIESSTLYMPFHRVAEPNLMKGAGGRHGADVQVSSPIKRFKGSSRDMVHPIDALIQDTFAFMNAAYRQQAATALFELSKERGAAWFSEHVAAPQRIENVQATEILGPMTEQIAEKAETGEIAPEVAEQWLGALEELPPEVLAEVYAVFRPGDFWDTKNIVGVNDPATGDRKWFQLKNDALYEALTDVERFQADNWVANIAFPKWPARVLRFMATSAPVFSMARNPQRDMITSYIQSNYGLTPVIDHFDAGLSLLANTAIGERLGWDDTDAWRFKRGGGEFATLIDTDRNAMRQAMRKSEDFAVNGVVRDGIDFVRNLSAMTENVSRMAEFKRAYDYWLDQGVSAREAEIRAGLAGREVAVDFARHGMATGAIRGASAFWNATLQGWDKMLRTFKNHPVRTTKRAILGVTVPEIVHFLVNGDDEDYWELPLWQRWLYWHIPVPDFVVRNADFVTPDAIGNFFTNENDEGVISEAIAPVQRRGDQFYVRFAKPHVFGAVFGSMPGLALEQIFGRNTDNIERGLGDFVDRNLSEIFMPIPTAYEGIIENIINLDLFRKRAVVPQELQDVEPRHQYNEYTSPVARMISDAIYEASGERAQVSPIKLENLYTNLTATWGREADRAVSRLMEAADAEHAIGYTPRTGPTATPLAGGLVSVAYETMPESTHQFYGRWEEVRSTHATLNRLIERAQGGDPRTVAELEGYIRDNVQNIALYPGYRDVRQELSLLFDLKTTLAQADLPNAQQRRMLMRNYAIMARLSRGVLQRETPDVAVERLIEELVPEGAR